MQGRTRDYAERDNLDLPEVPRLKGDARHSVRLGISSGLAHRNHQGEEPKLPLSNRFEKERASHTVWLDLSNRHPGELLSSPVATRVASSANGGGQMAS